MPAALSRRPHEFSGGQCQRVAIARAVTVEARLLIADEVTCALDVTIRKQILELLSTPRHRFGLRIVFISHDVGHLPRMRIEAGRRRGRRGERT